MASRREPIFNWPIVICLIAFSIFLWPVKWLAGHLFIWLDFNDALIVGSAIIAAIIAGAFSYDHLQTRRSRQLQQLEPNDFQSPEK